MLIKRFCPLLAHICSRLGRTWTSDYVQCKRFANTVTFEERSAAVFGSRRLPDGKMEECVLECLQQLHEPIPLPDNIPVRLGRSPQTQITEARCSRLQVEIQVNWKTREIKVTQLGANTTAIDGQDLERGKTVCMTPDSTLFILKGMYPHKVAFKDSESKQEAKPAKEDMPATAKAKKRPVDVVIEEEGDCSPSKKHRSSKHEQNGKLRNGEEKEKAPMDKVKESKQKSPRHNGDSETKSRPSEEREQVVGKKRPREDSKERTNSKHSKKDSSSSKKSGKVTDFLIHSKNEKDRGSDKREKDRDKKESNGSSDKKEKHSSSASERREKRSDSSSDRKERHSSETRDRESKSSHKSDSKTSAKTDRKPSSDKREHKKSPDMSDSEDDDARIQTVSAKLDEMKKKAKLEKVDNKASEKTDSKGASNSKASEKKKSSVDSKCKTGKPASVDTWDSLDDKLYIFTSEGVFASEKIAGFDIDGTIITTQSGRVFPKDITDWKIWMPDVYGKLKKLIAANYKIVFFTNQLGVGRGKVKIEDLQDKFEKVVSKLQVPVQIFISTKGGSYRKPALGMWQILKKQKNDGIAIRMSDSFYVGDAAGRGADWAPKKKKDFSCSDRLFAINAGLTFHTPEEFFLGYKPASFTMPDFDPRSVKSDAPLVEGDESVTSDSQEVVVFVGLQASGKTTFAKLHLIPKGYVHINQDTLKTWQKCVNECTKALNAGKSVVIDNTNVDPDIRAKYIDCARKAGKPCRCFYFDFSFSQCRHNERFREITNKDHKAINEQIFNSTRSKFKAPELREGFSKIVKVNFVPQFPDKLHEKVYRQFLLEK